MLHSTHKYSARGSRGRGERGRGAASRRTMACLWGGSLHAPRLLGSGCIPHCSALRIALNPTAFGDYNGAMGERTPEWKINSGQGVGTPLSLPRGRVGGEGNLEKTTLASGVRSCRAWPCTLSLLLCLECSLSHPRFPWDIFSLVFLDQGPTTSPQRSIFMSLPMLGYPFPPLHLRSMPQFDFSERAFRAVLEFTWLPSPSASRQMTVHFDFLR